MPDFIKPNALKNAFKTTHKIRSTDGAVRKLVSTFNETIGKVMAETVTSAQAARRTTVLEEDAVIGIEKHLAKRHLAWDETAQEVFNQTPAGLGKISKAIQDYIASGGDKQKLLQVIAQVRALIKP